MSKGSVSLFILIIPIIVGIALAVGGAYYFGKLPIKPANNTPIACTLEAMVCPDGSAVGRTGPNCEFAPCPDGSANPDLIGTNRKTYTNGKYNYSVKYPERLTTEELIEDIHLSLVTFSDKNLGEPSKIFSIEVKKSSLEEAIKYAKWTIEGHVLVNLKSEAKIDQNGTSGIKLEYVPEKPDSGVKPITFIIFNNKDYSYILDFLTDDRGFIDQILSTFKFIGQEYMVSGNLTKEASEKDIGALGQAVSKQVISLGLLEKFPAGFQITTKDKNSCEEVRKILSGYKFVDVFGDCQKIEVGTTDDSNQSIISL